MLSYLVSGGYWFKLILCHIYVSFLVGGIGGDLIHGKQSSYRNSVVLILILVKIISVEISVKRRDFGKFPTLGDTI